MEKIIVPPIKCQGKKTKLVKWIKSSSPDYTNGRWVEPFLGSGSVAFNMLPKKALLCDSNPHIIQFYENIKNGTITSSTAKLYLEKEGEMLRKTNGEHYYTVRQRFNQNHDSLDFLFINRSCFNGLMRFNKKHEFNVPFCKKPNRFAKSYVTKICNQIKNIEIILNEKEYEFITQGYQKTIESCESGDLIYCDPPYIGRSSDYFNQWSYEDETLMSDLLKNTDAKFMLSSWKMNKYRTNDMIDTVWKTYNKTTKSHFYHLGGSEKNRSEMTEILITNF